MNSFIFFPLCLRAFEGPTSTQHMHIHIYTHLHRTIMEFQLFATIIFVRQTVVACINVILARKISTYVEEIEIRKQIESISNTNLELW